MDTPCIRKVNRMNDLISRQAAIDATWFEPSYTDPLNVLTEVRDRLKALPSAQPKSGRWIYCEDTTADCVDGYRCDQCGFFVPWDYQHKSIDYIKDYNFCPMCGSYNGGEQDDRDRKSTRLNSSH